MLDPLRKQVNNGQVLHHTLWNYMFEPGTDKLTPGGYDKLDSITRERPSPDPRIFLQIARDIPITSETADKLAELRTELDGKRAAAVMKYMATQPALQPVAL